MLQHFRACVLLLISVFFFHVTDQLSVTVSVSTNGGNGVFLLCYEPTEEKDDVITINCVATGAQECNFALYQNSSTLIGKSSASSCTFQKSFRPKPTTGGPLTISCEANDFSNAANSGNDSVEIEVREPPSSNPVMYINNDKFEMGAQRPPNEWVRLGEDLNLNCSRDGGYPPIWRVHLDVGSKISFQENGNYINRTILVTDNLHGEAVSCRADHMSGCYYYKESKAALSVAYGPDSVSTVVLTPNGPVFYLCPNDHPGTVDVYCNASAARPVAELSLTTADGQLLDNAGQTSAHKFTYNITQPGNVTFVCTAQNTIFQELRAERNQSLEVIDPTTNPPMIKIKDGEFVDTTFHFRNNGNALVVSCTTTNQEFSNLLLRCFTDTENEMSATNTPLTLDVTQNETEKEFNCECQDCKPEVATNVKIINHYGPDELYLHFPNGDSEMCPDQDEVTVWCLAPKYAVNPRPTFCVLLNGVTVGCGNSSQAINKGNWDFVFDVDEAYIYETTLTTNTSLPENRVQCQTMTDYFLDINTTETSIISKQSLTLYINDTTVDGATTTYNMGDHIKVVCKADTKSPQKQTLTCGSDTALTDGMTNETSIELTVRGRKLCECRSDSRCTLSTKFNVSALQMHTIDSSLVDTEKPYQLNTSIGTTVDVTCGSDGISGIERQRGYETGSTSVQGKNDADGFILRDISCEDAGRYTCRGQDLRKTVDINVDCAPAPKDPEKTKETKKVKFIPGEDQAVVIPIRGYPEPAVALYKVVSGSPAEIDTSTYKVFYNKLIPPALEVIITDINNSLIGSYTISLDNGIGKLTLQYEFEAPDTSSAPRWLYIGIGIGGFCVLLVVVIVITLCWRCRILKKKEVERDSFHYDNLSTVGSHYNRPTEPYDQPALPPLRIAPHGSNIPKQMTVSSMGAASRSASSGFTSVHARPTPGMTDTHAIPAIAMTDSSKMQPTTPQRVDSSADYLVPRVATPEGDYYLRVRNSGTSEGMEEVDYIYPPRDYWDDDED